MSSLRPIIIKKIKKIEGGHHGGAWKVAYADFVTAMMAFFLLMWLLNATTEEQRSGLADYFDPKIPISQNSSGGTGMFNGDSVFAQGKLARSGLGGSGKQAAAGRDTDERHEVSSSEEDVWSPGQKEEILVGNKQETFELVGFKKDDTQDSSIHKNKMTQQDIQNTIKRSLGVTGNKDLEDHLNFKMTDEGLRIDITDGHNNPMFLSGSDRPSKKMQKIIAVVGNVLSQLVNNIAITGHTDSQPLKGRYHYTNWELSSDRAHAARRGLMRSGIAEKRIQRIEGRADREPFLENDPTNAQNRRITIILLKSRKSAPVKPQKKINKRKKSLYDPLLNTRQQITKPTPKSFSVPDPLNFRKQPSN
ncbi:MAG: chemotaxis protein MotB [Alphaproteobacteria bacterium]|jgi:chemotaxis protein MotB